MVLEDIDLTRELKQVTNYTLGLRIPLSTDTALKIGFFTDNSNGVIDFDIPFQRVEAIDTRGISVAYETKLMGYPLTLGLYAKQGDGRCDILMCVMWKRSPALAFTLKMIQMTSSRRKNPR